MKCVVFATEWLTVTGQHVATVYRLLHSHGTDLGAVCIPLHHAASLRHFRQQTGEKRHGFSCDRRQWRQTGQYNSSWLLLLLLLLLSLLSF